MKILILTSHYPPLGASGHDVRCQQVAKALSNKGHRLQILTSNFRLPPGGIREDKGVFREFVLFSKMTEEELSQLSYQDVLNIDFENIANLDDRISRFEPDLVLVWSFAQLSKSILMRLQQLEIPVAYDLHAEWLKSDVFYTDPWQWWWKNKHSFGSKIHKSIMTLTGESRRTRKKFPVVRRSDLDLSLSWLASASLRDTLTEDGLKGLEDVPIIHSALDLDAFEQKRSYTPAGRFMWAGRLLSGKAPEIALEAIAMLKAAGEEVNLDIFGMGEPKDRKQMRERINSMGLDDCVEMVAIRPGEMTQHYANYDALLVTSVCDDPFPMTPLEAMMTGLPCILSNDGGITEIVDNGETALLYERGDAGALKDAILRFLQLPDAGASIALACKQQLNGQYSMNNYVEQIHELVFSKISVE